MDDWNSERRYGYDLFDYKRDWVLANQETDQ